MGLESQLRASAWLGFREEDQPVVFPLLEFDSPSCKAMGKLLSMDMSPCASGEECHLFDWGDHLDSGLGEVVTGGHPCGWGALANGMDWNDDDDCPNKMW